MTVSNALLADVEGLAGRFSVEAQQDASAAVGRWRMDVAKLHPQLAATASRLADRALTWEARNALNRTPDGARLLLEWSEQRRARPELPRFPFLSTEMAYAYCASIVHQRGTPQASRALEQARLVVLGLRRETSTLDNKGLGVYDDHIAVLNGWNRRGSVKFFPASTEPGAQYAQRATRTGGKLLDDRYKGIQAARHVHGEDVDRDGIRDAGRLLAGTYFFKDLGREFLDAPAFQAVAPQTVERDTNGDGRFTLSDADRIDPKGVGRTMYIHRGGMNNTGSAGCQTIRKDYYPAFLSALGKDPRFFYVLVDCR